MTDETRSGFAHATSPEYDRQHDHALMEAITKAALEMPARLELAKSHRHPALASERRLARTKGHTCESIRMARSPFLIPPDLDLIGCDRQSEAWSSAANALVGS